MMTMHVKSGTHPASHSMPLRDKFDRFEAWLKENGAQFDSLELREYDPVKRSLSEMDEEEKKEPKEVCDLREESEMRGVHARVHIPPNSVCMVIPRKCLITVEMGQATPIGQAILSSDLDLDAPKHIFLMIYLLWDRKVNGTSSFFYPYYDILPRTLKNMPIFWSPEELSFLQGSHLLVQINDRNVAIADDYKTICQIAPELESICTLEEFKWARMCVCSRNFGLQIDGHRTSALVPHADMLNHYRPRETKWTFDDDRQAFTITTLQAIPPGAEVYDSYGQKCNHRFLLNYGFAVEDNRELDGFCPNEVPLELGIAHDDPLHEKKMEFWTRGDGGAASGCSFAGGKIASHKPSATPGIVVSASALEHCNSLSRTTGCSSRHLVMPVPPVKRVRVCVSNNENTRLLFSFLRAISLNEEELRTAAGGAVACDCVNPNRAYLSVPDNRTIATPSSSSLYKTCRDIRHPISLHNEKAAMTLLTDVVSRSLALYPTTLSQDLVDLHDDRSYPRFSNKRHAKIQVKGEKEVLHHFLQWARTALEVLHIIEQELEDEAVGRSLNNNAFESVIRDMEENDGFSSVHHTIVRYCADVLGSLRREELRTVRMEKTDG